MPANILWNWLDATELTGNVHCSATAWWKPLHSGGQWADDWRVPCVGTTAAASGFEIHSMSRDEIMDTESQDSPCSYRRVWPTTSNRFTQCLVYYALKLRNRADNQWCSMFCLTSIWWLFTHAGVFARSQKENVLTACWKGYECKIE